MGVGYQDRNQPEKTPGFVGSTGHDRMGSSMKLEVREVGNPSFPCFYPLDPQIFEGL